MAYYDAFIAAWNAGGKPAGASGTSIVGGMTTGQKLDAVNSWTVAGPQLAIIVPTYKIYNAIDPTEWAALSAAQQQQVRDILTMGTVDASNGTNVRAVLASVFSGKATTLAALTALVATFKPAVTWWQSTDYPRQFDSGDAAAAGLS